MCISWSIIGRHYYLCISFYSSFNNNIIILISYGPAVVSYFISIITCGLLYMFVFSESFIIVTPLVFYFALHGWSRDVVREWVLFTFITLILLISNLASFLWSYLVSSINLSLCTFPGCYYSSFVRYVILSRYYFC